jgi:hypothetical protein
MRVALLVACALALEVGWLALWPLSATLSHSARFTASLIESHPLIYSVLQTTSHLLPSLAQAPLTGPLGSDTYTFPATLFAGLMLGLAVLYGLALLLLNSSGGSRVSLAVIVGGAALFQVTLLFLPGVFSQDVFSYIAYGRLAAVYDLNPYIWPPSVLRDPVVPWVADVWRTYATPYAPLWVNLQWLLARLTGTLSIADQALVYRGLANVLLLTNLALAWRLLGRLTPLSPTQRATSLAALAWNPLVLFEIAANAHNDALMVSFCFMGLLVFRSSSRGILSCIALTLGTLVKYLSGVGLIWLALACAARLPSWRRRIARVGLLMAVSIAISLALAAPWLELPDSLDPLWNETAGVGYVNSLPDALVVLFTGRNGAVLEAARSLERVLAIGTFAIYLAWEASRVWAQPGHAAIARALARSTLIYVLVASTSVQTWYFCLPVSIAVALGCRRRIARISLAYSALALPVLYLSYYLRDSLPPAIFVVYAGAPLLVLLPDVVRARFWPPTPAPQPPQQQQQPSPPTSLPMPTP